MNPIQKHSKSPNYTPPVAALLTLGDPRDLGTDTKWPDYPNLCGLGQADIPELVRMVQDNDLNWADSESLEVWASLHAWRALGQLQSIEAVVGLVDSLHFIDEGDPDWMQGELPVVFEMIGPTAVPALESYLTNKKNGLWSRVTVTVALQKIGNKYEDGRDACVSALVNQLEQYKKEDETLNGFVIDALAELKAVEARNLMETVFSANKVDSSIRGDWEDIQIDMGLLPKRLTPKPNYFLLDQKNRQQKAAAEQERKEQAKVKRRRAHENAKKKKIKKKKKRK